MSDGMQKLRDAGARARARREAKKEADVGQPTTPNPDRLERFEREEAQNNHLVAERGAGVSVDMGESGHYQADQEKRNG